MTTQSQTMSYPAHIRALLLLGLPIVGGHLGQLAIGMTDTVMVGRYGVDALAAIALGATYLHLFMLVGSGFAWAVMPLVATFEAEDDQTSVRRATRMGLWLSTAFCVLSLPMLILPEPILRLLGQEPQVVTDASTYLRVAGWGIFPWLALMVLKSYLAALERTMVVLLIILASAVLNAMFNYAFIFGNWGAPELGLLGAAWASVLTQSFGFIFVLIYALRTLPEHALLQRVWRVDGPMMRRVFNLGWPIGLTTLAEAGLFSATAFMMGVLGKVELAAHGVIVQLASATFVVHMGVSNAATVRAGNALGRRDKEHLSRGAVTAFVMSLAFAAITVLAFLLVPEPLIQFFLDRDDPKAGEVLSLGIALLAVAALFQVVDGAQVIALGLLRGVQDTRVPMIMAAISYWIVGMPASYVLGFTLGWGGIGIWIGLVLGLSCAAGCLIYRFWRPVLARLPVTA